MNEFSESYYNEKPLLTKEEPRSNGKSSFVSLLLFVVSLLVFFGTEYRFMIELLAILLLHEMGHFVAMKRFNYNGVRMLFIPLMGGFVQGEVKNHSQRENIIVAFSGPIPGIIIGVAFWILGTKWNMDWMLETAYLSFFLNVSNLLPLQPLDGGRVFKSLFIERFESLQMLFTFISSLILIGIGYFFEIYVLILFGFIMGVTVRNMHRKYLIHKALKDEQVNYTVTYDELTNKAYARIKEEVFNYSPTIKKFAALSSGDDDQEFDQLMAREVKNNLIQPVQMDMSLFAKSIVLIMWLSALIGPVLLVTISEFN
jgi:stage IV sporulation protein FB